MNVAAIIIAIAGQTIVICGLLLKGGIKVGKFDTRLEHIERELVLDDSSSLKSRLVTVSTQLADHIKQHNRSW